MRDFALTDSYSSRDSWGLACHAFSMGRGRTRRHGRTAPPARRRWIFRPRPGLLLLPERLGGSAVRYRNRRNLARAHARVARAFGWGDSFGAPHISGGKKDDVVLR